MPKLPDIRGLLVDLDGTLYQGDQAIPGAADALAELERRGVRHCFVTNVTSRPLSAIVKQLAAMGLNVQAEQIFSAPRAAASLLRERGYRRCHFLLRPALLEDFDGIESTEDKPDAVVIGDLGDGFTFARLNAAFRFVLDGAALVTLARNRFFRAADGLSLDVGPFVAALEYATQTEATLVGKPSPAFFNPALDYLGITAADAAVVGDDIEGDVGGGQSAGMRGVLVRTGKFRPDTLQKSSVTPDLVLDSLADIAGAV